MSGRTRRRTRDGWALVVLAAWSCYYFFRYGGTAYEWPAVDIAPLVARQLDPDFLANDFFTNASAETNPRHVFGFLMATLARCFGGDWYAALYLLRVVAAILLPVLWYLALIGFVRSGRGKGKDGDVRENPAGGVIAAVVVFAGIAQVIRPVVSAWFSIAWWPPFQPQATSATYSLVFALAGSVLLLRQSRASNWAGVVSWMVASLLHPAVSLFAIVFHAIATFDCWRWSSAAVALAVGWLLPCASLAIACRPTASLTAEEFIRAYVVVRHPSHYLPAEFGTLTGRPWWESFFLLTALMLAAVPYAAWRRDRRLTVLALALAATYVGCVGLQYVAVVGWPNKLLAMLGPVRFTSFGFFAWLLLAALIAADMVTLIPTRWRGAATLGKRGDSCGLSKICLPRWAVLPLLVVGAIVVGLTFRDDPFERSRKERAGLFAWIAENTSPEAVFASPDDYLSVDVALVAERPVFAGFGFPFREDFFAEYAYRDGLLFGTPEQRAEIKSRGESDAKPTYFHSLSPRAFAEISAQRQLDFVIVAAAHAGSFGKIPPAYADESWRVYAIYPAQEANSPPPTP